MTYAQHFNNNVGQANGNPKKLFRVVRVCFLLVRCVSILWIASYLNLLQQLGDVLLSLGEGVLQFIPLLLDVFHLPTQQLQTPLDSSASSAYPLPLVTLTKTTSYLTEMREREKERERERESRREVYKEIRAKVVAGLYLTVANK